MKKLTIQTMILFLLIIAAAFADVTRPEMKIMKAGSQATTKGTADKFTGTVTIELLFQATEPARTSGGKVTFEPGARSAWHSHPLGQALIVTEGTGYIQQWGSPIQEIKKGDVIWTPPGVKHWHGATPDQSLTHIAVQENLNGKTVEWKEKVSDEQYNSLKKK